MSSTGASPVRAAHARRALLGVILGALLAAMGTVLVLGSPRSRPAPSPAGTAPARTPSAAEQVYARAHAGDCLTWDTPSAADVTLTDCTTPHRFEVAAGVDLRNRPEAQFGPGTALPGPAVLTQLRDTECTSAVRNYLVGRFDPHGLFSVGLIDPGEAAWRDGQRDVLCGLQEVGTSGEQFPIRGRVAQLDQSDVAPLGSCQSITSGLPSDPVDCAQPHASEVISVVDLTKKYPGPYPSTAEQDGYLDAACRAAADAALGGPDAAATKGLTVYWSTVAPDSWAAGSRRVNCKVGRQVPGGGFAPTTGVARNAGAVVAPPPTTLPTALPPTTTGR